MFLFKILEVKYKTMNNTIAVHSETKLNNFVSDSARPLVSQVSLRDMRQHSKSERI